MNEAKVVSTMEKILFVKFSLFAVLAFGLSVANPVTQFVIAGAHMICALTLMSASGCPVT
jgi:hypothetical protein